MNILLTGKPGIGKSTVIGRFIENFDETSLWMLTNEVLGSSGQRVGFKASTSTGLERLISHKSDIHSEVVIGSNHVNTIALRELLLTLKNGIQDSKPNIIILDEIGPIQLSDPLFIKEFDNFFESKVNLLASIHINDERLVKYRDSPNAISITITESNRGELPETFEFIFSQQKQFNNLGIDRQYIVNKLSEHYIKMNKIILLKKLFINAIPYYSGNKIEQISSSKWNVLGDHGSHLVKRNASDYTCTCDLFLGLNQYVHMAGECSHIQAVKLYRNML